MSLLSDLFHLFVPRTCPACGAMLIEGERTFCTRCLTEAPLTDHPTSAYNPLLEHLRDSHPIERAASLIAFPKGSGWRNAVHQFKYEGAWRVALECGEWLGEALAAGGLFYGVDLVVPVPLHPLKFLSRGYNQATYIAEGVADALQRPYNTSNLIRRRHNPSQTLKKADERWENVEDIFALRRPEEFDGKHILLVDDVVTSGATLLACAKVIQRHCPTARISVATFASAHYI